MIERDYPENSVDWEREREREKELEGGEKGRRREKILYEGQRDEKGGSWCVCVSVCLGFGWGGGVNSEIN